MARRLKVSAKDIGDSEAEYWYRGRRIGVLYQYHEEDCEDRSLEGTWHMEFWWPGGYSRYGESDDRMAALLMADQMSQELAARLLEISKMTKRPTFRSTPMGGQPGYRR